MRISRGWTAHTRMYSLGGLILKQVNQAKYLGVTITEELTWSPNISNITGKANSKIGFLWRILHFCPQELREQAYFTFVHSIIEYSASVWDPHLNKDITLLDRVQCKAARFVVGDSSWHSSVTAMLHDLGWNSLEDQCLDIRLALFFKAVHGLAAIPTTDILIKANSRTMSNHPHKFRHITANSTAYRQSSPPPPPPPPPPAPYLSGVACHQRLLLFQSRYSMQSLANPPSQTTHLPTPRRRTHPSAWYPVWEFAEYPTRQDKTSSCVPVDQTVVCEKSTAGSWVEDWLEIVYE